MARHIPFSSRGVCIDCGERFVRDGVAWRCRECTRGVYAARYAAMRAVRHAVKAGVLAPVKSLPCTDCEQPATHYDHRDYSQPLNVTPTCRRCNFMRGPAAWQRPQYAA